VKVILKEQQKTDRPKRRFAMSYTGYHSQERRVIEEIRKGNYEAVDGLFAFPLGSGRTETTVGSSRLAGVAVFVALVAAFAGFLLWSPGTGTSRTERPVQVVQGTR
jgi:hypothetical protein